MLEYKREEFEWEDVLADPSWVNGTPAERNEFRNNYYEHVILPQSIAENKDVGQTKSNFFAETSQDFGINLPVPVFEDEEKPGLDEVAISALQDFQKLGLRLQLPGFAGVVQRGIGAIVPAYRSVPILEAIRTNVEVGLEEARRDPVVNGKLHIGNVANNLVQGGAMMTLFAPEFFAHMASDPINTTAGLGEFGIQTTKSTVNALAYVTGKYWGFDENGDTMQKFKLDYEHILTRPEEPLVTFMIASGMISGAGRFKKMSAADLVQRNIGKELKPANWALPNWELKINLDLSNQGIKSMKPREMMARQKRIDADVLAFMNDNVPFPENYAEGVLQRSANRLGIEAGDVILKAKRFGTLSRPDLILWDEFNTQATRIAKEMGKGKEEFLLDRQRKLDAFENHVAKKFNEATLTSAGAIKEFFHRTVVDNSANVKSSLRKLGAFGSQAAMMHDLNRGSSSEAIRRFKEATDRVFGGKRGDQKFKSFRLKHSEELDLGKWLESNRTQEIDLFKLKKQDMLQSELNVLQVQEAEIMAQIKSAEKDLKGLPKRVTETQRVDKGDIRSVRSLEPALRRSKRNLADLKRQRRDEVRRQKDLSKDEKKKEYSRRLEREDDGFFTTKIVDGEKLLSYRGKLLSYDDFLTAKILEIEDKVIAAEMRTGEVKAQLEFAKKGKTTTTEGATTSEQRAARQKVRLLEGALGARHKMQRQLGIRLKEIPIKHPGGFRGFDHLIKNRRRRMQWGDEKFNRITNAAKEYEAVMRENLKLLLNEGLIDLETFRRLEVFARYSPRKYLDHEVFAPLTVELKTTFGRKASVSSSGVEPLGKGSESILINDPKWLMWQSINRVQSRIGNNRAANALLQVAEKTPDNGVVELKPPNTKIPNGKTSISAVRTGKDGKTERVEMLMDNANAAEWIGIPPEVSPLASTMFRNLSGTSILKPMATGINPEFFLSNIPRDIGLIYMTIAGTEAPGGAVYSPFAPRFLAEIAHDIITVMPDALSGKGRAIDYLKEGGGMEFLSDQGQIIRRSTQISNSPVRARIHQQLEAFQELLSWTGKKSELLTRLAIRERAINKGFSPLNATHLARSYLDFNQGGSLAKAADNVSPYLNPSIQATRGMIREAKNNPARFAFKAANVSAFAASLYFANTTINKDVYDAIDDDVKRRNWVFPLPSPFSRVDKNGDTRHKYFAIPKDQGQRVIAGLAEALMSRYYEGKFPTVKFLEEVRDFSPVGGGSFVSPSVEAYLALISNEDVYFHDEIWKGNDVDLELEVYPNTPKPIEEFANLTGQSPVRMHRAIQKLTTYRNPFAHIGMMGYKVLMQNLPEDAQKEFNDKIWTELPGVRRLVKETNPRLKRSKKLKVISREENSRQLIQNRELKTLVDIGIDRDIKDFIRNQPKEDESRLDKRWTRQVTMERLNLPARFVDMTFVDNRVRALAFYREWVVLDKDGQKQLEEAVSQVPKFVTPTFEDIFEGFVIAGKKIKDTK